MAPFSGIGVALVTLFTDELAVDYSKTAVFARELVDRGMRAVLVCGTTGQAEALTTEERVTLVSAVVDVVGNDAYVIAGTGAPTAERVFAEIRAAVETGVAAVLVPPPADVGSFSDFYAQVNEAAKEKPVFAYNIPSRYQEIPLDVVDQLPGVVAHKDSSGDLGRLEMSVRDGLTVYTGATGLVYDAGRIGAAGALLGSANAFPELAIAAFDGGVEAQQQLDTQSAGGRKGVPGEAVKRLVQRSRPDFPVAVRQPASELSR